MKCINCGVPMFNKPLSRTNPKGQPNAGWMCQDCIKDKEPELYQNLKEDGDLDVLNDIFTAINDKKNELTTKQEKLFGKPFDVEVIWTEQTNNPSPLGEVTFPFERSKKGTLRFGEEIWHHPFFIGKTLEQIVTIGVEQNCLIEGVVDSIRIDKWEVINNQ